eukprot:TRINITY_DN1293_c0_g1_i2.p1 TRINITY_DN1293_c0_g1~~TRINITY_DN1293_c0_g1_i2.p1  ORF type:complete len:189 (+),score=57.60 TRINITY_DN1293_c0_g1_i2:517-1083(+)
MNQISDIGLQYLHDSLEENMTLTSIDLEDNLIKDKKLLEKTMDLASMNASDIIKFERRKERVRKKQEIREQSDQGPIKFSFFSSHTSHSSSHSSDTSPKYSSRREAKIRKAESIFDAIRGETSAHRREKEDLEKRIVELEDVIRNLQNTNLQLENIVTAMQQENQGLTIHVRERDAIIEHQSRMFKHR